MKLEISRARSQGEAPLHVASALVILITITLISENTFSHAVFLSLCLLSILSINIPLTRSSGLDGVGPSPVSVKRVPVLSESRGRDTLINPWGRMFQSILIVDLRERVEVEGMAAEQSDPFLNWHREVLGFRCRLKF